MTGTPTDFITRLKATLPTNWFADTTPILDGLLAGLANLWTSIFALLQFTRLQTRLATATDGYLDAISMDFLGAALPRHTAEPDSAYRNRIHRELLRERNTRLALSSVLTDLTGRPPVIFEPGRPADTGAWGGPLGYGLSGGWGSLALPFQCFVTAFRAQGSGISLVSGWVQSAGGYGQGALTYASLDMIQGAITDSDLDAAIARVMPVSTVAWTRISN